jgi:hypothetical protein
MVRQQSPEAPSDQPKNNADQQRNFEAAQRIGQQKLEQAVTKLSTSNIAKDLTEMLEENPQVRRGMEIAMENLKHLGGKFFGIDVKKIDTKDPKIRLVLLLMSTMDGLDISPAMNKELEKGKINIFDLTKAELLKQVNHKINRAGKPQDKQRWERVRSRMFEIISHI